jgi:hypothetical protein
MDYSLLWQLKEYSLSALRDPGMEAPPGSDSLYPHLFEDVESNDIGSDLNEVSDLKDETDMAQQRTSKKKRSRKLRGKRSASTSSKLHIILFFMYYYYRTML